MTSDNLSTFALALTAVASLLLTGYLALLGLLYQTRISQRGSLRRAVSTALETVGFGLDGGTQRVHTLLFGHESWDRLLDSFSAISRHRADANYMAGYIGELHPAARAYLDYLNALRDSWPEDMSRQVRADVEDMMAVNDYAGLIARTMEALHAEIQEFSPVAVSWHVVSTSGVTYAKLLVWYILCAGIVSLFSSANAPDPLRESPLFSHIEWLNLLLAAGLLVPIAILGRLFVNLLVEVVAGANSEVSEVEES